VTVRRQPASSIVIGPSVSTCRSTLQPTLARWTLIVTAATFRDGLDLSMCDELPAGRSDYRFGHAEDGGRAVVARLGELVEATLK